MGTGTEIQQSSQLVQSSSEKTQSRFSFSAAGPTAYRNSVDTGNGADGIGFGNRQKEYTNLRPHQYSNPDEGGYRRDNVSVGVQSRSLDSRPSGLHTQVAAQAYEQSQNVGGQSIQTQQLRFEEDANGAELLKYSLSTPPKHPHRLQYASYHSGSNVGTIGATLQSDPSNRYNPTLGVGSYVSESGSSPGGGTPFYLPMAAVIGQTGTGANPKDGSAGRGESRARSGSNFTGLGLGETEGDVTGGGGVSAASPPYLGFSTHLMSTSPEIGHSNGAMNNLERSQGAITLYQTPGCRRSLRGEAESRLQHNSQLVVSLSRS